MIIKTFKIDEVNILPKDLEGVLTEENYCILDIETTGLNSHYNKVVLIGILYRENKTTMIKQIFAENTSEEAQILREFSSIFKNFSYLITYNGASFDIPFLKRRFSHNKLDWDFNNIKHIDILQFIRRGGKKLALEDFKLKTVEKFLGIDRRDTISGKDSVLLYKEYVKNPTPSIKKTILLHNYEDVYHLNKLLNIFDYIDVGRYDLTGKDILINYKSQNIIFTFYPRDTSIKRNILEVNGRSSVLPDIFDIVHYDPNFQFNWYPARGKFDFSLPLEEAYISSQEKCKYIDLNSFNLSKYDFNGDTYYHDKFFPNSFMILSCQDRLNTGLAASLFQIIFERIFEGY